MDIWNRQTLKYLFFPGGVLLAVALVLLKGRFVQPTDPVIHFYYYGVFLLGVLLAWRFRSNRVLFILFVLLLAHRAIQFFSQGIVVTTGPGRTALEAVALLIPLNFIAISFLRGRGLSAPLVTSRLGLLFLESVFVAVICSPERTAGPSFLHATILDRHWFSWTALPQPAVLVFIVSFTVLLARFFLRHRPVESGLLWSLAATFLALQAGGVGPMASALVGTAGLILVGSIIENSYVLAFHDELTSLPSRRAFNDALLDLTEPYAIAVVDIDHFKKFNDTYGHETGDHVLRMVATRLARVSGGGKAFRVGGEEFNILFPGKSMKDALVHLELLRATIENAIFHLRRKERRHASHGTDRRRPPRQRALRSRRPPATTLLPMETDLSVTVSIGVAQPTTKLRRPEQVIQAADQALYRAKQAGRNQVATAGLAPVRSIREAGHNLA